MEHKVHCVEGKREYCLCTHAALGGVLALPVGSNIRPRVSWTVGMREYCDCTG